MFKRTDFEIVSDIQYRFLLQNAIIFPADAAYFDRDAYNTMIITAWIAFVDTTEENGCMEVSYQLQIFYLLFVTVIIEKLKHHDTWLKHLDYVANLDHYIH